MLMGWAGAQQWMKVVEDQHPSVAERLGFGKEARQSHNEIIAGNVVGKDFPASESTSNDMA